MFLRSLESDACLRSRMIQESGLVNRFQASLHRNLMWRWGRMHGTHASSLVHDAASPRLFSIEGRGKNLFFYPDNPSTFGSMGTSSVDPQHMPQLGPVTCCSQNRFIVNARHQILHVVFSLHSCCDSATYFSCSLHDSYCSNQARIS